MSVVEEVFSGCLMLLLLIYFVFVSPSAGCNSSLHISQTPTTQPAEQVPAAKTEEKPSRFELRPFGYVTEKHKGFMIFMDNATGRQYLAIPDCGIIELK